MGARGRGVHRRAFRKHFLPEKECRRGSRGVAIALSRGARRAWEQEGSQRLTSGPRYLATRLIAIDPRQDHLPISS